MTLKGLLLHVHVRNFTGLNAHPPRPLPDSNKTGATFGRQAAAHAAERSDSVTPHPVNFLPSRTPENPVRSPATRRFTSAPPESPASHFAARTVDPFP